MSVSYVKFCPQCQTTNNVDTAACVKCGHKFRTHFAAPVSEKTIAMTSASVPSGAAPVPPAVAPARRRPRFVGKIVFLAICACLAFAALRFGSHVAGSGAPSTSPPAPAAAMPGFRPYDVVFQSDAQGYPVPLATQTAADLGRYKPSGADSRSVGLYHAGRILLVYPGTAGRVIEESADWRRVTLLNGTHKGTSGYVGVASVRTSAASL